MNGVQVFASVGSAGDYSGKTEEDRRKEAEVFRVVASTDGGRLEVSCCCLGLCWADCVHIMCTLFIFCHLFSTNNESKHTQFFSLRLSVRCTMCMANHQLQIRRH